PDRRVGGVSGQAEERATPALHVRLDRLQRGPGQLLVLLLLPAGRLARGLLREQTARRGPAPRADADESGGAGEALPPGRADAARRCRTALHREQPAAARLLEAGEGVRPPPDGLRVLRHGGDP